jgi:hypothetical protein
MAANCIEDLLGNSIVAGGKPYSAYKHISENWGENWNGVQPEWKDVVEQNILKDLFDT